MNCAQSRIYFPENNVSRLFKVIRFMSFVQNKLAQANAFYLFIFLCVL